MAGKLTRIMYIEQKTGFGDEDYEDTWNVLRRCGSMLRRVKPERVGG